MKKQRQKIFSELLKARTYSHSIDAERELEGVTYISVSDESGRMDDDLFDMLSEEEQRQSDSRE